MAEHSKGSRPPGAVQSPESISPRDALSRVLVAILVPAALALLVGVITGALFRREGGAIPSAAPLFAALGIASWFIGLRFYGLRGLGLRIKRPLWAGIGFAVLAWVIVLIGRFLPGRPDISYAEDGQAIVRVAFLIETLAIRSEGSGRAFFFLLLFEAFATQLWTFGLVFRALADWRGALAAAVGSGILYGMTGFLLFQESFVPELSGLLYFLTWGVLYGMIRLRTGSLLGPVLIQALQTFTVWFVFQPPDDMPATGIRVVYLFIAALFAIVIWRLWPRRESDYRI
jgi:membrane protease YdiL (CAAX protease family)